jgi:hypothetical protein
MIIRQIYEKCGRTNEIKNAVKDTGCKYGLIMVC